MGFAECQASQIVIYWLKTCLNLSTILLAFMIICFVCFSRPKLPLFGSFNILFISATIVDILTNLSRVFVKYLPVLLSCQLSPHIPLHITQAIENWTGTQNNLVIATLISASDTYFYYTMLLCSIVFNFDHMILVAYPKHYYLISSPKFKWIMVITSWSASLLPILPMFFSQCCQSHFLLFNADLKENLSIRAMEGLNTWWTPVFLNTKVGHIYEIINMLIANFVYTPLVFTLSFTSICVLLYHHKSRRKKIRGSLEGLSNKINVNTPIQLNVDALNEIWITSQTYFNDLLVTKSEVRLSQHRIENELKLAWISLIDQSIDAVGMFFYLIYLGASNEWIHPYYSSLVTEEKRGKPFSLKRYNSRLSSSIKSFVLGDKLMSSYSQTSLQMPAGWLSESLSLYELCYEVSTLSQPYIVLLFFPKLRQIFSRYYCRCFCRLKRISTE